MQVRMIDGLLALVAMVGLGAGLATRAAADDTVYDVVVYGGTSAAVTAAVQVKRMGASVVVVSPDVHLGGLSSSGLGWTDTGNRAVVGGLSREFYHRLYLHYARDEAWNWQPRDSFQNRGQHGGALSEPTQTAWIFEPSVAEATFDAFIDEYDIPLHRDKWLDRENGVEMDGPRIVAITTLAGDTFRGRTFIDATYEGDLMAAAGVSYAIGREANEKYDETLNGIQTSRATSNQLPWGVDPYVEPGNPESGLLPGVNPDAGGEDGEGDQRLQAFCFRLVLTDVVENRLDVPQPDNYDARDFELLFRAIEAGQRNRFYKFDLMPNRKTDSNNASGMSNNLIGGNYNLEEGWNYAEASYEEREKIIANHRYWQQGLVWTLRNHPRVPEELREQHARWGLPKDEFLDNDHWPHQIYVREARRMVGDVVVAENHVRRIKPTDRSIGMGSYNMDSHNVQRHVVHDEDGRAHVRTEGDVQVSPGGPYPIDYGAIIPKQEECENLLVPVAVSASHIAFGSIRMEPVFMILGQSAATAAVMAIDDESTVQQVPYEKLRERLLEDGQVLEHSGSTDVRRPLADLEGVVVDVTDAQLEGEWTNSTSVGPLVHLYYRHDDNARKGEKLATFKAELPAAGRYEVRVSYTTHANRATNVPVTVRHAQGETGVRVNQRQQPSIAGLWHPVGTFDFDENAEVVISNAETNGHVIIDAVQWLPAED